MIRPMTGTIILSREDSAKLRQNLLYPGNEYIQERNNFFDKLDSCMVISSTGTDSTVEFADLDLSGLDAIIEKEVDENLEIFNSKQINYVSTSIKVSFINNKMNIKSFGSLSYIDTSLSVDNGKYACNRHCNSAKIQGCNLTEAA